MYNCNKFFSSLKQQYIDNENNFKKIRKRIKTEDKISWSTASELAGNEILIKIYLLEEV